MRRILKYISLIALLFIGVGTSFAQTKNIYLKFAGEKEGLANIDVYSFRYELEANKAITRLRTEGSLDKQHDNYISKAQTGRGANKGRTRINVPNNGWVIFDLLEQQFVMSVASAKVVDNEYIFELKQSGEDKYQRMDDKVNIRGRQKTDKKTVPGEGSTCNGLLYVKPYPVIIDSIYAHNNARFVLSPIVVSRKNPKDTIGFLPPRVIDGIDYDPSQVRFTGFDQTRIGNNLFNVNDWYFKNKNIIGEEPMSNFFNKGMKTREQDTIYFQCKISPYDDKNPWKIIGHCWYEDYNTVYYERNILLYAGYTTKPSQFLDWRSSIPEEELDALHYSIDARTEAITTPMELKLDFKVGEATLNYADSATMANLNSVESRINSILNNDNAEFHGISLCGYASPEGSEATNNSLALKRTQTVRDYLAQRFAHNLYVKSVDYKIVPWTDVADTLAAINAEGYADIATELREICNLKSSLNDQWGIIKSKSWYANTIQKDSILDKMRRVRIETEYVEQKELTSKEIFQRFENEATKTPFKEGSAPAYQYYQLMTYLYDNQDWDALYDVAKVVYNISKDAIKGKDDGNQLVDITERFTTVVDTIIPIKVEVRDSLGKKAYITKDSITYVNKREPLIRPHALAPYYIAKCKLQKGEITAADTMLLKDYLDDSNQGLYYAKPDFDGELHYWNEEAIVITQILIHCAIEDFNRARYLALYHLPRDGKYETFQSFLKFLSCDEDEDKEHTRRLIEETSPNNFVVANLTKEVIDGEVGFVRALKELEENKEAFMKEDTLDATYYYLLAICKYKKENPRQDYEVYYYDSRTAYDPNPESLMNWGAPMLEAFRLDPKWVEFLKEDGYFNDAYRSMMLYFWERMKDGVRMADIAREYDELAKKYFATKQ